MADRWYYRLMGEEFGPVDADQIRDLLQSGILSSEDTVRADTSDQWLPVASVSQLRLNPEDMEVVSDLDDLHFVFEDSGPSRSAAERHAVNQSSNKSEAPGRSDSRQIAGSSGNLPDEPSSEPLYYARVLGQVMGPMPLDELTMMVTQQVVGADDEVRPEESEAWQPARTLAALTAFLPPEEPPAAVAVTEMPPQNQTIDADKPAQGRPEPRPTPGKGKPKSGKKKGRPATAGKKSGAADDPMLEDIFDEVFADDSARPSSGRTPGVPAGNSAAAAGSPVPATGQTASAPADSPQPVAENAAPAQVPAPSIASLAAKASAPPPVVLKKSRSSIQLPGAKTLGILGVVATVGLVGVAFSMGWISLPGPPSTGTRPVVKSTVMGCYMLLKAMGDSTPKAPVWEKFRDTVDAKLKPLESVGFTFGGPAAPAVDDWPKAAQTLIEVAAMSPSKDWNTILQKRPELEAMIERLKVQK